MHTSWWTGSLPTQFFLQIEYHSMASRKPPSMFQTFHKVGNLSKHINSFNRDDYFFSITCMHSLVSRGISSTSWAQGLSGCSWSSEIRIQTVPIHTEDWYYSCLVLFLPTVCSNKWYVILGPYVPGVRDAIRSTATVLECVQGRYSPGRY